MPATIRDIAQSLNISHTTVSRVLNGRGAEFISEGTRKRVIATAAAMNYRPNRSARALATGRTHMIALWTHNITRPYFVDAMRQTEKLLRQSCYDMIIRSIGYSRDEFEALGQMPVDGVLALNGPRMFSNTPDHQSDLRLPIVSMGCYYTEGFDFVGIDLYSGSVQALEHLLKTGCRRVAYLVSDWGNRVGDARYDGYVNTMQAAGLKPEFIVIPDNERATTRRFIRDYVTAHGCPEGLFCFSDDLGIGAYRGLCDLGLRMPDDLRMVGCDGIEETEYLECPISTLVQPHEAMCALAWQYLQERIEDPNRPLQQTVLQPELVIRRSSQS